MGEMIIKRKYGCKRSPHNISNNGIRMSQLLLDKAPADLLDYPNYLNLTEKYFFHEKSQGLQGCCVGMSISVLAESFLKDKNKELSPAFLYWVARSYDEDTNEDSGACIENGMKTLKEFGICEEGFFPYDENIYDVEPSKEAYNNAKAYRINTYINIDNGISGIKSYLYTKQKPVVFGMEVYEGFARDIEKDGLVSIPNKNDSPIGGHSALIVGYKDNTFKDNLISVFNHKKSKYGYFIVLNSYGKDYSKRRGSLFYLPYEYIMFNKAYDFYVITTGDNPNYKDEIIDRNKEKE